MRVPPPVVRGRRQPLPHLLVLLVTPILAPVPALMLPLVLTLKVTQTLMLRPVQTLA